MVGAEPEMRLGDNLLVRQEEPCGQLHTAPRAQLLDSVKLGIRSGSPQR